MSDSSAIETNDAASTGENLDQARIRARRGALTALVIGIIAMALPIMFFMGFGRSGADLMLPLWLVAAISAIVAGSIARRDIKRVNSTGRGMATTGVVLGWVSASTFALSILSVLLVLLAFVSWGGDR